MCKVILFTSGKGGTGKTMITANMGALLATRGNKTLLIDMDMGLRNLDMYLGLQDRVVYNVMDVVSGVAGIKKAIVQDRRFEDLYLMAAAPMIDDRDITCLHMEVLCERLKGEFDYILIDSPAGIGDGFEVAAAPADIGVIVTEAEYASVRDADIVAEKLLKLGKKNVVCIVNKVNGGLMAMGSVPNIPTIAAGLRVPLAGIIQYDDNVFIATNRGVPIVIKPGTYIEKNFSTILDRILGSAEGV